MMQRCYNKQSKVYHRYGGRGIYVCDEWHDFLSLLNGLILLVVGQMGTRWTEKIMTVHTAQKIADGQPCATSAETNQTISLLSTTGKNKRLKIGPENLR